MIYIKDIFEPRQYQIEHAKMLTKHKRALLVEKTGRGKTMVCLYAFAVLKEFNKADNLLVLTPLSAYEKQVWKADIDKWTNLKSIDIESLLMKLQNFPQSLEKLLKYYNVIYAKHSHLKQPKIAEFITMIFNTSRCLTVCDEVHAFKNSKSKLTMLAKLYLRATYGLWGLTATPLSKNLEDTYNICNFVKPWFFGSFPNFRDQWCRTKEKVIGRAPGGRLKKAIEIVGIKDEMMFNQRLLQLPVLRGESSVYPNFNFIDYELSDDERTLYRRIAKGIDIEPDLSQEDWIKKILGEDEQKTHPIKDVAKYSSRFIYLQSAADGILSKNGTQDRMFSTKTNLLCSKIEELVGKKETVLVYFDYYASLEVVNRMLVDKKLNAKILLSTGENKLKPGELTEAKCKAHPYVVLCTRAASESESLYFIKNAIFFQIPTIPSVFTQFVGRITRINTLYPNDLQVYIFRSENIDLYKLQLVSIKSYQMELVSGEEKNIPSTYKCLANDASIIERQKKLLLWNI